MQSFRKTGYPHYLLQVAITLHSRKLGILSDQGKVNNRKGIWYVDSDMYRRTFSWYFYQKYISTFHSWREKKENKLTDAINELSNILPKDHKRQESWTTVLNGGPKGNNNYMQCRNTSQNRNKSSIKKKVGKFQWDLYLLYQC